MSWSVDYTGTPEAVTEALNKYGANLTGHSKEEYDAALPHLIGLVKQNYVGPECLYGKGRLVRVSGSGSGSFSGGKLIEQSCTVKVEPLYSVLV